MTMNIVVISLNRTITKMNIIVVSLNKEIIFTLQDVFGNTGQTPIYWWWMTFQDKRPSVVEEKFFQWNSKKNICMPMFSLESTEIYTTLGISTDKTERLRDWRTKFLLHLFRPLGSWDFQQITRSCALIM